MSRMDGVDETAAHAQAAAMIGVKIGTASLSKSEMAIRNAQTMYASENSQGLYTAIAGAAAIGVGFYMNKGWLVGIGIVVLVMGTNRMGRAGKTYNNAQLDYAKSMGANTVA